MPADRDADEFSVSDIGVDSILEAAGLTGDHEAVEADHAPPLVADFSDLGLDDISGFGATHADVGTSARMADPNEFTLGFGDGAAIVPDDHSDLSGVDSGFFGVGKGGDAWDVPEGNGDVIGGNGSRARRPFVDDDDRTSSGFAADPLAATLVADETPALSGHAGIVQRKRTGDGNETFVRQSTTRRPVLLRPDSRSTAADESGQRAVLGRARVATRVVRRSDFEAEQELREQAAQTPPQGARTTSAGHPQGATGADEWADTRVGFGAPCAQPQDTLEMSAELVGAPSTEALTPIQPRANSSAVRRAVEPSAAALEPEEPDDEWSKPTTGASALMAWAKGKE